MKSVYAYINAQAATRIPQQASREAEVTVIKAQCGECNYDNDYYGDRVCRPEE